MSNIKKLVANFVNEFYKLNFYVKVFVVCSLVCGSLIRAFNLFNQGFIFDMVTTQYTWGKAGFEMGYFGFWKDYSGFFDYWPVTLLIEIITYTLSIPFGGSAQNFVTITKIFNWIVEIVFCLTLVYISAYKSSKGADETEEKSTSKLPYSMAYINASLAYIVPSLWFVSGVWGQNDTLIAFLTFAVILLMYYQPKLNEKKWLPFYKDNMFWSGVLLAVAFWTKQQAVLILPVLIIFHLYQKTWKNLLNFTIWLTPFLLAVGYGISLYSTGKWEQAAIMSVILFVLGSAAMFVFINKKDSWQMVRRQSFGFILTTSIIMIPLIWLNYRRAASTTFAVFGRTDNVANGGATFWGLIDVNGMGSDFLFKISSGGVSVNLLGYLVYLILMVFVIWKLFDVDFLKLKKLNLQNIFSKQISEFQFVLLMFLNTTAYFLFFTKMHSRYLHFGIVFGLLSLAFLTGTKYWKRWLVLSAIFSVGYFLNQIAMYSIAIFGLASDQPRWVYDLLNMFGFSPWKLSSLISFVCLILFYQILQVAVKKQDNKLKVLDNI